MVSSRSSKTEIAQHPIVVATATPLDDAVQTDLPCASYVRVLPPRTKPKLVFNTTTTTSTALVEPARVSIHILSASSLLLPGRLGLTLFNPSLENLSVVNIKPSSPLINYIQPGFLLESYNGKDGTHAIPQVVYRFFQEHSSAIHLVFSNPQGDAKFVQVVGLFPEFHSSTLGLTFQKHHENLTIAKVQPGSLFSTSLIQPRDQVVSINGESCVGLTVTEAATLACQDRNRVSIVTRTLIKRQVQVVGSTADLPKVCGKVMITADEIEDIDLEACIEEAFDGRCRRARFISLHIVSSTPVMMEGLVLGNSTGSSLEVAQVPSEGPLANSPLRVGVAILSINHRATSHIKPAKALKWMRGSTRLSLIAMDLAGDPDIVEAAVCKSPSTSSVGLVFRQRTPLSPVRIHEIRSDGLFVNSVLNPEDVVLAINGISCEYTKPSDAVTLVQRDSEFTTIVAKPEHAFVIVLSKTQTQNKAQSARSLTFLCDVIIAIVCGICFVVFG